MKINQLQLQHFGQFAEKSLVFDPHTQVHVIYGKNEAGKSTLHRFLRAMFFGVDNRTEHNSLNHAKSFGRLVISKQSHTFTIEREGRFGSKQLKICQMTSEGAMELNGEGLSALSITLSPQLFTNIYCFNHQQLQQLQNLQADELSSYLFHSMVGGNQAVMQLEKELEQKRKGLFKPRAIKVENTPINQILKQLEDLEEEITVAERQYEQYLALNQREQLIHKKKQELELQREALNNERFILQKLIVWQNCSDKLKPLYFEVEQVKVQLKQGILKEAQQIKALYYEYSRIDEIAKQLQVMERDHGYLQGQINQELSQLGFGLTIERILALPSVLPFRDQALQWEEQEKKLQQQIVQLKLELVQLEDGYTRKQNLLAGIESEKGNLELQIRQGHKGQKQTSMRLWEVAIPLGTSAAAIYLYLTMHDLLPLLIFGLGTLFTMGWFGLLRWRYAQTEKLEGNHYNQLQLWLKKYTDDALVLKGELEQLELQKTRVESGLDQATQELQQLNHHYLILLQDYHIETKISFAAFREILDRIEKLKALYLQLEKGRLLYQEVMSRVTDWIQAVQRVGISCAMIEEQEGQGHVEYHYSQAQQHIEQLQTMVKQQEALEQRDQQLQLDINQLRFEQNTIMQELEASGFIIEKDLPLEQTSYDEQISHIQDELDRLKAEQQDVYEELGKIKAEKEHIANDQQIISLKQQHAEKVAELQQLAMDWASITATQSLLRQAKRSIEEDRQPYVLKVASQVFQQITGGKYERIISPIEEAEFYAVTAEGERYPSAKLSQGTKEQLYLSLRIGYIKQQQEQEKLPIILDDPFVNFDKERLGMTLSAFTKHIPEHQIILFTCHDHIVSACQYLETEASIYHLDKRVVQV